MNPISEQFVDLALYALSSNNSELLAQVDRTFHAEFHNKGRTPDQLENLINALYDVTESAEARNASAATETTKAMLERWKHLTELAEHTYSTPDRWSAAKHFLEAHSQHQEFLDVVADGGPFGATLNELAQALHIPKEDAATCAIALEQHDLVDRLHDGEIVRLGSRAQVLYKRRDDKPKQPGGPESTPAVPAAAALSGPIGIVSRRPTHLGLSQRHMIGLSETMLGEVAAFARHHQRRTPDSE